MKNAIATRSPDPLHVDILRGREQFIRRLMLVVDCAARTDGTIRAFAPVRDTEVYSLVGPDYDRYITYCQKKKVRKHFVIPSAAASSEYPRRLLKERGSTVRIVEAGLSSPTATIMTPELISLDLFGEEVVSIMIWNKTIAKSFLEHFAIMWRAATPYKKPHRGGEPPSSSPLFVKKNRPLALAGTACTPVTSGVSLPKTAHDNLINTTSSLPVRCAANG